MDKRVLSSQPKIRVRVVAVAGQQADGGRVLSGRFKRMFAALAILHQLPVMIGREYAPSRGWHEFSG